MCQTVGWSPSARSAHAADAENDLLLDAHGPVAAVKAIGDAAVAIAVPGTSVSSRKSFDPAHDGAPDAQRDRAPLQLDAHAQIGAALDRDQLHRQLREVGVGISGALIAFAVDGLGKVALAVKQTDCDQRHAHVACRLAVITGKDSQTSGVDWQAFVETEFGAEIRDQIVAAKLRQILAPGARVEVGIERSKRALEAGAKNRVLCGLDQPALVDSSEESPGITGNRVPQRLMQPLEQLAGRSIPAVPEIAGQVFQSRKPLRDIRIDFQRVGRARRLHAPLPSARDARYELFCHAFWLRKRKPFGLSMLSHACESRHGKLPAAAYRQSTTVVDCRSAPPRCAWNFSAPGLDSSAAAQRRLPGRCRSSADHQGPGLANRAPWLGSMAAPSKSPSLSDRSTK
jgi:hypothetical protein